MASGESHRCHTGKVIMDDNDKRASESPPTDQFKSRLAMILVKYATDLVDNHPVQQEGLAPRISEIMDLIREALETPGISPAIDTHFVRAMMGKVGERPIGLFEQGTQAITYPPDPAIEIFCRCYETERKLNLTPDDAAKVAMRAAAAFKPMMSLFVPGTRLGA